MNRPFTVAIITLALLGAARPADADVTAFLGANRTPGNRPVRGFAAGVGLLVVGFEFEYSDSAEDLKGAAPRLRTGMGNVYVQNPIPTAGMQFYATVGGGLFREQLGTRLETNVGTNIGGGVKIALAGPFRLRLDYRIFTLAGNPLHKNPQRLYAGITMGF